MLASSENLIWNRLYNLSMSNGTDKKNYLRTLPLCPFDRFDDGKSIEIDQIHKYRSRCKSFIGKKFAF